MSQNPLIIPIAAQALIVSKENEIKKVNLKNQLAYGENILGKEIQFDLDNSFEATSYFEKGIYIHWNIPKIFKHGTMKDDGNIDFPAVPNHWMVVRLSENEDTSLSSKTWIIQSDVIDENDNPNFAFIENDKDVKFVKIGKTATSQSDVIYGDNLKIKKLTALSPINPYFSNIFDECEDVFGFRDDMEGMDFGRKFTYVIIGCFSDDHDDPLKNSKLEHIRSWISASYKDSKKLKINVDEYDTCLFQNYIFNVAWKENIRGGVHPGDVNIAVGHNLADALSTMIVRDKGTAPDDIVEYLTALQNKLLDDTSTAGMVDVELLKAQNHEKTFSSRHSGVLYELKNVDQNKKMPDVQNGIASQDKVQETPYFPNDQDLVMKLRELNDVQQTHNKKSEESKNLRQLYYFKWYQNVENNKLYQPDEALKAAINDLKKELNAIEQRILGLKAEINAIISQKYVKPNPDTKKNEPIYELITVTDHPFWEPNEPSILFRGDGLGDVDHFHTDITDKLQCRAFEDITKGLSVIWTNGNKQNEDVIISENNININHLLAESFPYMDANIVVSFLKEAILLGFNFYHYLHHIATVKNVNLTPYEIEQAQKLYIKENLPLVRAHHQQAWDPLFLLWKVKFISEGGDAREMICQGFVPITAGAKQSIADYSESTAEHYSKTLGQTLSGFHKQLIAQLPSLQILPLEYKLDDEDFATSLNTVDHTLLDIIGHDGAHHLAPMMPNTNTTKQNYGFNPLRKGKLEIVHLSLVDTFGQLKTLECAKDSNNLKVSKSLQNKDNETQIALSPKILQPSRLQWDWINKDGHKIYQDSAAVDHPIIGWLVPNYLDKQILIYNAKGQEIMGIRNSGAAQKVEEFLPLNDAVSIDELKNIRKNAIQAPLQQIIDTLDINDFLDKCEILKKYYEGSGTIQEYHPVHLLYGKPVAIARATLNLETLGPTIYNPINKFDNTYLKDFTLSVTIKNKMNSNHGLVGYFLNDDYTKIIYADGEQKPIVLSIDKPKNITVLLKAGTECSLETDGWLPAKSISLFNNAIDELTQALQVSFLVSPVISGTQDSQIITPNLVNNEEWVHKSNVTTWQKPDKIHKVNQENQYFGPLQMVEGWVRMNQFKQENK